MTRVDLEKAVELILDNVKLVTDTQQVGLMDSLSRILACDMVADADSPPFDRSPVDGYALRSEDVRNASKENPVVLDVIEEVTAGDHPQKEILKGQASRIMTGAPIPKGADCNIFQEQTDYGDKQVEIYKPVKAFENYCYRGEDYRQAEKLIKKGTRITSSEIGILASMGYDKTAVYRKPRIALFVTGDEIIEPGTPIAPGKIYNSNQYMLAARLTEMCQAPEQMGQVVDRPNALAEVINKALQWADLIVTTGGVSVGKKDIVHEALEIVAAQRIFWKVNLKPGSPTVFSVKDSVPILSLTGNPFGVAANTELLLRPLLSKLSGDETLFPLRTEAVMASEFLKASKGRRFIRAIYSDGKVCLPAGLHSSSVISNMHGYNCLIDIAAGTGPLRVGDRVQVVHL